MMINMTTRRIVYAIAGVIGAIGLATGVIDQDRMDEFTQQFVEVASSLVLIVSALLSFFHTHRGSDSKVTDGDLERERQDAFVEGRQVGAREAGPLSPDVPAVQFEPEEPNAAVVPGPLGDPVAEAAEAYDAATAEHEDTSSGRHFLDNN